MKSRTIELVMPSGYPPDAKRVARAVAWLEEAGHRVIGKERLTRCFLRFGGTDGERLQDINLLGDQDRPLADIVLAVRGGYGLTRLLDQIDYRRIADNLRSRPAILVGHSDFTLLQLALLARTGLVTFSGPMLNADFGEESPSPFTWQQFWTTVSSREHSFSWHTDMTSAGLQVNGMLWGGNLTLLCSLLGTPYFPAVSNGILFVEDVNEPPFRIERLLYQLAYSGILEKQKAVLLGGFTSYRSTDYDRGYDLPDVWRQIRQKFNVPVICGLPYGHIADRLTLPVGARASVAWQGTEVTLQFTDYPHLAE